MDPPRTSAWERYQGTPDPWKHAEETLHAPTPEAELPGAEKAAAALKTDWQPVESKKNRSQRQKKDAPDGLAQQTMDVPEPPLKGKGKGKKGIPGRPIWLHRVFHFTRWFMKLLNKMAPQARIALNAVPRTDFIAGSTVLPEGGGTDPQAPPHMVLDMLRAVYTPGDLAEALLATEPEHKEIFIPGGTPLTRGMRLEIARFLHRKAEYITLRRKESVDSDGKLVPLPDEESLHWVIYLVEVLPQQGQDFTTWGITLLLDQTVSEEPHKARVHWRDLIEKLILVPEPILVKDVSMYELEQHKGELQV